MCLLKFIDKIKRMGSFLKLENIIIEGKFKTSVFRNQQNYFLRRAMESISGIKSVLNVGASSDDSDKEGSMYRDYFKEAEFYTLDKNRESSEPHHFNMDLHDLAKLDKKFDLILLMSTLEHVKNPFVVANEIKNLMGKGSYLFISVPFFYPIHKDPEERYSDYWRFTDDSLRVLFSGLKEIWIKPMNSSIKSVLDRDVHWEKSKTISGYGALFQK